jgi:hypothetical protein
MTLVGKAFCRPASGTRADEAVTVVERGSPAALGELILKLSARQPSSPRVNANIIDALDTGET